VFKIALCLVALFVLTSCGGLPRISPAAFSDIAPTGKLRVGINYANPVLATRDPASGELHGVTVDLARELGRRLDVPVELIGYATVGSMLGH
jgi:polar amino acid transport system substrate-binding protein